MESHADGPADKLEISDLEAAIVAALSELPERQRVVIELIYLHGLTGPEAARVLGVPIGTVKSRQNRALRALRPLLEEFDDVY
jgi:RNA polymerase sigma-70 factor (ECF subfamily)